LVLRFKKVLRFKVLKTITKSEKKARKIQNDRFSRYFGLQKIQSIPQFDVLAKERINHELLTSS
jgi:hypothetical protein